MTHDTTDRNDLALVIAHNVHTRRAARGWSQVTLAQQAGVQPQAVAHIECAKRVPGIPILIGLVKALGTTLDAIVQPSPEVAAYGAQLELAANERAKARAARNTSTAEASATADA